MEQVASVHRADSSGGSSARITRTDVVEISAAIFRAYDIRGVVDDALSPAVVREIGRAFGSECLHRGQCSVVVARDGRLSGPALVDALTEGLLSTGCDVIDIGMVPTPVLYFATHHLRTGTGVMVTGSHNPPEYNGLKMLIGGDTLYSDGIAGLHRRLLKGAIVSGRGKRSERAIADDYLQRIVGDIRLDRKMRIGIDCGNGVAGALAPTLFRQLGCEVVELFCEVDGHFPNHHPDPSDPVNLRTLIDTVKREPLDIGLAFDGDGDRLGVVDNGGTPIWPDRQMMLFAEDIIARHPGAHVIYDVKCSRLLPQAISSAGGVPEMWKTGHSFIKARIKETGALLGGEMSGHIFFKERWYGFDDALYAGARLLEILSRRGMSAQAIFSAMPDSISTPELNVPFSEDEHHQFMQRFVDQAVFDGAELTTIDGVRADFADGWGLVRASNTTPVLVIRFEADTQTALKRIQHLFRTQLLTLAPSLSLPF